MKTENMEQLRVSSESSESSEIIEIIDLIQRKASGNSIVFAQIAEKTILSCGLMLAPAIKGNDDESFEQSTIRAIDRLCQDAKAIFVEARADGNFRNAEREYEKTKARTKLKK